MHRDLSAGARRNRIQVMVQAGAFAQVPDLAEHFGPSAVTHTAAPSSPSPSPPVWPRDREMKEMP